MVVGRSRQSRDTKQTRPRIASRELLIVFEMVDNNDFDDKVLPSSAGKIKVYTKDDAGDVVPADVEENNLPPKLSASTVAFALPETHNRERRNSTVWVGKNEKLKKWKGFGPKIVLEQLKSSRSYSVKFYITILLFIFGFALCFIELGGNMKINQTAGKLHRYLDSCSTSIGS